MQREMLRRAKKVKRRAQQIAPVGDEDDPHRGAYKASLTASSGIQRHKTARAVGAVTADVPYAFQVEVGTSASPAHRTLGKALDAARD
jgi:hypothetical protein